MKFGLNLFSLRDFIKTEEDFLQTAEKLKEMGYSFLQYSGAEFDPERIKRVSEKTGMPICLTHVPIDRIIDDTDKLMDDHAVFGCKNIGLGALSPALFEDEASCKEKMAALNEAGRKMAEKGYRFFYHHHQFEFVKFSNGQCAIDYMRENCPYINFTLDTYWAQYGGADVVDFIKAMKGRIGCVHLKDYRVKYINEEYKPQFAPVGSGTLNFKKIVAAMQEAGAEYLLVEQDDAVSYELPFEEVRKSAEYLKEHFSNP